MSVAVYLVFVIDSEGEAVFADQRTFHRDHIGSRIAQGHRAVSEKVVTPMTPVTVMVSVALSPITTLPMRTLPARSR